MAINFNSISDYETTINDLILEYEKSVEKPYADSVGIPTIGIGFNMRSDWILKEFVNHLEWKNLIAYQKKHILTL